jgi:capsular exopolysaccharide synthesis family protein
MAANPADTVVQPWRFDADEAPPPKAAVRDTGRAAPLARDHEEGDEVTDLETIISSIPNGEKLVVRSDADTTLVEQFRRVAAALHHAQLQTGARTVMIASAIQSEGKTLTATNLALTLSQSYQRRVLLVDADLRRPAVHTQFRMDNRVGLSDVLKQTVPEGKLPVRQVSPTLWVMPAGRPNPDPMSGLVSPTMKQFLVDAADQFDWVVVDTPPVAMLPDANLLAAMIDTALMVVGASSTPYPLAARAVEAIGASRILGVVLNRADRSEVIAGYAYYGYSYSKPAETRSRRRFRLAFRKT